VTHQRPDRRGNQGEETDPKWRAPRTPPDVLGEADVLRLTHVAHLFALTVDPNGTVASNTSGSIAPYLFWSVSKARSTSARSSSVRRFGPFGLGQLLLHGSRAPGSKGPARLGITSLQFGAMPITKV